MTQKTRKEIEEFKKGLPTNTPFVNMLKINDLLAEKKITEEEHKELLNWNLGMEIF